MINKKDFLEAFTLIMLAWILFTLMDVHWIYLINTNLRDILPRKQNAAWKKCIWLILINEEQDNEKYEYYCFLLHKLWTYFNQTKNFKQSGTCSRKYTL